ncbi:MAG: cupin domain-containing protein [Gammaproteobacteria bacterium]|nr:MAG: cupin domain-containing protein [Gammaproteobacteria bacterium]
MARFSFAPGMVSRAVKHRRVEELWYVLSGAGEIWRSPETGVAEVIALNPSKSVPIPAGCAFQVRVTGDQPLTVIAVTMPPWPGDQEAIAVEGCWKADASNEQAPEN